MGGVKENNMTERLTIKNSDGTYSQPTDTTFEMVFNKLGELEDILEKYGIESVEELDKKIGRYIDKIDLEAENDYLKKAIEKQNIVIQSISKDRDAWKRACEFLAYEYAEEYFDGRDIEHCFNANKRDKFVKENINYFYQQAKTEWNDE